MLRAAVLLGGLVAAAAPGWAQGVDAGELAFWRSVQEGNTAAEYQAYLDTFPNGRFAALARLRLARLAQGPAPRPGGPVPAPPAPGPAPTPASRPAPAEAAQAWVRPARGSVRLVDGVTLDMDAQALRDSSNLRLAVVAANEPDTPTDLPGFVADSIPVRATRQHLSVPSGPPGRDEVRLYHIARYADAFTVAARAPVTVGAGVPGAVLARDLAREAAQLGPLRFEAKYRGRPTLVQAAFVRVRPQTEWNLDWFGPGGMREVPRQVAVLGIGQPGVAPDSNGSLGEVVCVLDAGDAALLARIAAMTPGDPVLVSGVPTSWASAGPGDRVLLGRCALAD